MSAMHRLPLFFARRYLFSKKSPFGDQFGVDRERVFGSDSRGGDGDPALCVQRVRTVDQDVGPFV